jgi:hypothetical protein
MYSIGISYSQNSCVHEFSRSSLLWRCQLVTSPLWAQELSFKHRLEIARTHINRQKASFLLKRVYGFCTPTVALISQLYSQPFGMPLSLHNSSSFIAIHIFTLNKCI